MQGFASGLCGDDAPTSGVGLARLEADEAVPASERVRCTRHRLDREAAARHVRKPVAGEDHHVRIALVDPESRPPCELDARTAVTVTPEIREAMVELQRADRLSGSEVELRSVDRLPADRDRAFVRDQCRLGRNAQLEPIHEAVAGREVRMHPEAIGARVLPHVRRLHPHRETVIANRVLRSEIERERVTGSRVQSMLEHGAFGTLLRNPPLGPAHEPVDRVLALRLVDRQLVALSFELVGPVLDPVRPGREQLPAAGATDRNDAVTVEHRAVPDEVLTKAAAYAHDDDPLVLERELDLLSGRADRLLHADGKRRPRGAPRLHPYWTMCRREQLRSFLAA